MNAHLDALEARTVFILREAFARLDPLGMLWSIGKDSNALLWMARKAFFGHVPFPLIQLDTAMELPEVYAFRDRLVADWNLTLKVEMCPPEEAMDPTLPPATRSAARLLSSMRRRHLGRRSCAAGRPIPRAGSTAGAPEPHLPVTGSMGTRCCRARHGAGAQSRSAEVRWGPEDAGK